jgi:hypothetical protein
MKSDKELNAKTMNDLILPAFELINNLVLSRNLLPEWTKEPERHEIKFAGPNGEACEFSVRAETRGKTPEDKKLFPVVVINWRRGILNINNTGHDPVKGLTPAIILLVFKNIFIPWFR